MDKNIKETLGARLKILRRNHNMKQKELSRVIGYTQGYVSDWECGRKIIPTEALMLIVEIFNINLDYFDVRNPNPLEQTAPIPVNERLEKLEQDVCKIQEQLQTITGK